MGPRVYDASMRLARNLALFWDALRAREGVVRLVTEDPDVAREFGMHDESEFFDDEP
jgi:hypothetical protein